MSEAWGTVCIPHASTPSDFHPDLLAQAQEEFLPALFDRVGFQVDVLTRGRFRIDNSLKIGEVLCLSVSEAGWAPFCQHVLAKTEGTETYASFYTEYGQRLFFAKNAAGESFSLSFEDDSDLEDQEGFDADSHEAGLSAGERQWLGLVPEELQSECPPLLRVLRHRNLQDGDFNWDRFVPERHSDKLDALRQSLDALYEQLSQKTVEGCAELMADITGLPPTDEEILEEAESFLKKHLDGFLEVLDRCRGRQPDAFLDEWTYGFFTPEGVDSGKPLKSPQFTLKEDLGKFVLVPR